MIVTDLLVSFIIISSTIGAKAYKIAHDLRSLNKKINIDVQLSEGSLKSKLRRANKDNADYAIIIGEEEIDSGAFTVKPLSDQNYEQSSMLLNDLRDFISNLN